MASARISCFKTILQSRRSNALYCMISIGRVILSTASPQYLSWFGLFVIGYERSFAREGARVHPHTSLTRGQALLRRQAGSALQGPALTDGRTNGLQGSYGFGFVAFSESSSVCVETFCANNHGPECRLTGQSLSSATHAWKVPIFCWTIFFRGRRPRLGVPLRRLTG